MVHENQVKTNHQRALQAQAQVLEVGLDHDSEAGVSEPGDSQSRWPWIEEHVQGD